MRKGRPATLTSSLLARKGEAEPARLNDGTVPKDVIALQEELVARVAADITRPGSPGPLPISVAPSEPALREDPAGEPAPVVAEAAPAAEPPSAQAEESEEIDVAEALGSAPIELPAGSADEPDYDPAEDAVAQQESQATLADWTARAQSGDTPFAYERMTDAEEPERSVFIPLALGATVVAVLATLAIWQVSDHGQVFPQGAAPDVPAAMPAAPAAPEPIQAEAAPAPSASSETASAAPAAEEPAAAAPEPASAPASSGAGGYAVQLVSTTSQETAEVAWSKLAPRITQTGLNKPHEIERADLGAKGVRYRVQLTGFASYSAGQKACVTLKAHKVSCLVIRQ